LQKELKPTAPKESQAAQHNKAAQVEIYLEAKSTINLGHPTNSNDNLTGQILPGVATKEENHPMSELKAAT
jgi:hypothetical protein